MRGAVQGHRFTAHGALHLVPGNHDVGDKRVDWMPADQVCSDYLHIYQRRVRRRSPRVRP